MTLVIVSGLNAWSTTGRSTYVEMDGSVIYVTSCVLSCHRFPCVTSFRAPIALCNLGVLKNKE